MIIPPNIQAQSDFVSTLKSELLSKYEGLNHEHRKLLKRMFEHSTLGEDGCWLYRGGKDKDGYGLVKYQGDMRRCHRLSAMLFLELDDVQQANHKCSYTNCWNPEHLYAGTSSDNARDAFAQGTRRSPYAGVTHCKHGHEFTTENTYIDSKGYRSCKICNRESHKKRYVSYR